MMKYSLNTEAIHNLFRICQRLIAICCCFLMFSSVAGVFFGGVPLVEKYAYIGEAVELVSNINSHYEDPTLYGENGTYLTSWKGNTSQPSDCQYEGKFHMDDKRNIWLLRVEREDAEKYSVKFGAKHKRHEVHIRLTVKEECPDVPKEGSSNSLIIVIGLVSAILVIVILDKVLTNKDWIRKRLKAGKNWIQEKLGRKQLSKSHENTGAVATIDGSDGWNPLSLGMQIVTFIIVAKMLLMKLENGNQIRKGLINMKDWIQKKLCSRHMPENEPQNQENESLIEVSE